MALHHFYVDEDLRPGNTTIRGDEAHHAARVKRARPGDAVQVLNGRGQIGHATIAAIGRDGPSWIITLDLSRVELVPKTVPALEVLAAAPKGPCLADMIEGLSQAGASSWSLLATDRGEVDPRPAKLERLRRTAAEASKQCGRAWALELGPETTLDAALTQHGDGTCVVLADASGPPYQRRGVSRIRLLIGPEGGWTQREVDRAGAAGAAIARFGPHVMRIETAAVVATGILLNAESRP